MSEKREVVRLVSVFGSNPKGTDEMNRKSNITKKQVEELYETIQGFLPSKERSICLTQLEQLAMTANKAIYHYDYKKEEK